MNTRTARVPTVPTFRYNGQDFKNGDKITCIICRTKIINAKIEVLTQKEMDDNIDWDDANYAEGDRAFYIWNNKKGDDWFDDSEENNEKWGYKYRWLGVVKSGDMLDYENFEVRDLKLVKELFVSPHDMFGSGRKPTSTDHLANLVQNWAMEERKRFEKAIGA